MFKKSSSTSDLDLFSSPTSLLGKRAAKKYDDPKAWHNQFFKLVTSQISEEVFEPLYKDGNMGAPNASIRILVAMSILKEGFGCSDEDLFEKCEFDMLTRKAMGLFNLDDVPPSLDTYYLFRRRICEYEAGHRVNLMEKCFESVTGEQIKLFKISGKSVRMDSKLIGSNIAQYTRYEIVHRTLCKTLNQPGNLAMLSPKLRGQSKVYLEEEPGKTIYRANPELMYQRLIAIGQYVYLVLKRLKDDAPLYDLLHRAFHDQYIVEKGKAIPRDKKDIGADSLHSPDDPEAGFRNKYGKKTHGYLTNITETVEEDKPSVITSVQTEPVTFSDCHFLQDAVANTERVTNQTITELYADGAYQSPDNREFCQAHDDMNLITGRIQGGCRFILNHKKETDELLITDTQTGKLIQAIFRGDSPKYGKRWKMPETYGEKSRKYHYFTEKDIARSELRQQIENIPKEERNKRNNVEATMFQCSFHTRNNKTRYRGLLKHRLHAYSRCMWMNLVRLVLFQVKTGPKSFIALFEFLVTALKSPFCLPKLFWAN